MLISSRRSSLQPSLQSAAITAAIVSRNHKLIQHAQPHTAATPFINMKIFADISRKTPRTRQGINQGKNQVLCSLQLFTFTQLQSIAYQKSARHNSSTQYICMISLQHNIYISLQHNIYQPSTYTSMIYQSHYIFQPTKGLPPFILLQRNMKASILLHARHGQARSSSLIVGTWRLSIIGGIQWEI